MGGRNKSRSNQNTQQRGGDNQNHYRNNRLLEESNTHSDSTSAHPYIDLNKVLQESRGGFLQCSLKEWVCCASGLFMFVLLSIFLGFAAGVTISIHYYEDPNPNAAHRMGAQETSTMYGGSASFRKVTTLDPTIASSNVVQSRNRDGVDLGKVITTSASGQLNVLMVVEEATPLHVGGVASTKVKSSSSNTQSILYGQHDGEAQKIQMTMEQANLLAPEYSKWKENQPNIQIRQPKVLPRLCSDGYTIGFDDWHTLKAAVQEANSISAERFMKWSAYFATAGRSFVAFDDDDHYYEQDVIFSICPGATLRARKGFIYINAENVIIECDGCTINVGGTHLNFGPHAKNVLVRGVTFRGAQSSSLTLFQDGAEASFEECFWLSNSGVNGKFGGVLDINSTSTVNFYRCEVSQGNKMSTLGSFNTGSRSSLSIRS